METSVETLIVAGTLVLLYGFLLGVPMAQARMAGPAAPRHLVTAHMEALIGGAILLALSIAASFSTLGKGFELLAVWLLIAGVVASLVGGTMNWLGKVDDQFAAKSPGFLLQAAGGPAIVLGGLLLTFGVLKAL